MKIGDTVWEFDENHRVYERDKSGRATGAPIYREQWRPQTIIGETSRSWLVGPASWCDRPYLLKRATKVPKSGLHPGIAFSEQEVDDQVWINDYRYNISAAVNLCSDASVLRQIAALLGFKP